MQKNKKQKVLAVSQNCVITNQGIKNVIKNIYYIMKGEKSYDIKK